MLKNVIFLCIHGHHFYTGRQWYIACFENLSILPDTSDGTTETPDENSFSVLQSNTPMPFDVSSWTPQPGEVTTRMSGQEGSETQPSSEELGKLLWRLETTSKCGFRICISFILPIFQLSLKIPKEGNS